MFLVDNIFRSYLSCRAIIAFWVLRIFIFNAIIYMAIFKSIILILVFLSHIVYSIFIIFLSSFGLSYYTLAFHFISPFGLSAIPLFIKQVVALGYYNIQLIMVYFQRIIYFFPNNTRNLEQYVSTYPLIFCSIILNNFYFYI